MLFCPKCKSEIDSDSRFCDQCGQELFYCTRCGRVGKGLRCIFCGSKMSRYDDMGDTMSMIEASKRPIVTKRETIMAAAMGVSQRSGIPHLILVNDSLHLRLAGTDGAILGRRKGIYQEHLASCQYISGTHAQLNYSMQGGWSITDKGSSNGTYVNGRKIMTGEAARLSNGDRVVLANVEFRVEISR